VLFAVALEFLILLCAVMLSYLCFVLYC
jgi:hypothetical protein